MLIIIAGYAGTGKTTLAYKLAEKIDAAVLSTDTIEKHLQNMIQDKDILDLKYPVTLLLAKYLLKGNRNVILDGNFRLAKSRNYARKIADEFNTPFYIAKCICPEEIAMERIKKKNEEFPGYYKETATFSYAKLTEEPIDMPFLEINTALEEDNALKNILKYINHE